MEVASFDVVTPRGIFGTRFSEFFSLFVGASPAAMASSLFRWPFSMFNEGVEHDSDGLQHLRDALEKAERQVSSSTSDSEEERERKEEILDGFRAKLEEFEVETQKKVKITICSAVSGESIAQVRLRPTDFVVQLCEAVVKETSHKVVVAHSIIFQSEAPST